MEETPVVEDFAVSEEAPVVEEVIPVSTEDFGITEEAPVVDETPVEEAFTFWSCATFAVSRIFCS